MIRSLILLAVLPALSGCAVVNAMRAAHAARFGGEQTASTAWTDHLQVQPPVVPSGPMLGSWSYVVNQQARQAGCVGNGAWLATAPDEQPQTYVVHCADGATFTMVCNKMFCAKP